MSIGGMMRTSISGMQAQSNRLSAVADNIANSDTNGYKRTRTDFSSMVLSSGGRMSSGAVASAGGVLTSTRQLISQQGSFEPTASSTDLAIQGNGFFVVQDNSGTPFFTRAGSFVPDSDGVLINSSGYYLSGYSLSNGNATPVANGFTGLEPVSISGAALIATPTTSGRFSANLPADAAIATAPLPSANVAASAYTNKSSVLAYDNLGRSVLLDIYMTKTAAETWEVAIYSQADAAAGGGFPYSSAMLATQTLNFSPADGMLTSASASDIALTIPGGTSMTIDLEGMSQLATTFIVSDADTNGNPPSGIEQVDIGKDGTLYARYGDGSYRALYKIPLATVTSPDQMTALTGTVYAPNPESGAVTIGFADEGAFGQIISSSLEQSNVDIAEELTAMIQSQRGYTANSKVFQTGSELMDVVVNLKR